VDFKTNNDLEQTISRFRQAAFEFVGIVEAFGKFPREVFLAMISDSLAELYSSALRLPLVEPDTAETDDAPFGTLEWVTLFNSLREKIGSHDGYWTVFDSTEKCDPVQGSLAGDISEIYSDLKDAILILQTGAPNRDSLWELRFSFRSHWAKHALGALTAIHDLHVE
jgi:hypothetical protein